MWPRRARDAQLLADCGGVVKDTARQDVLPRLEFGLLASAASAAHGARGTLFPQPRLAGGALMDERLGCAWRLVTDGRLTVAPSIASKLNVIEVGPQALAETEGVVAAWMHKHACHAALLRPGHYVFGVAPTAAELDALLADWHQSLT